MTTTPLVHRLLSSLLAIAIVVRTVGVASADPVGEVTSADPSVRFTRHGEKVPPPIEVGDAFETGEGVARLSFKGDIGARLEGRLEPPPLHAVSLDKNSAAEIIAYERTGPSGARFRFKLSDGTAYALFTPEEKAEYGIETKTAIVIATGTALVVSCNATSTDVITLSGTVLVRSLVMREQDQVTVGAGQMTSVAQGAKSLRVFPAPLERVRQATEGMELIGAGRGESLTQADGVLAGREVLPAEQSNLLLRPSRELLDLCPGPSAVTCISAEPLDGFGTLQIEY